MSAPFLLVLPEQHIIRVLAEDEKNTKEYDYTGNLLDTNIEVAYQVFQYRYAIFAFFVKTLPMHNYLLPFTLRIDS